MTRTFSPSYRKFLGEALEISDPSDIPHNLQDLYIQRSTTLPEGIDPTQDAGFIPRYGFDDTVTTRLMQSRANFGGFEFRVGLEDGTDLGSVVATRDATLVWPDGTYTRVLKGTPLNVINPDIFADAPINMVAGGGGYRSAGMPLDPDTRKDIEALQGLNASIMGTPQTPVEAAREAFLSYEPLQAPGPMADRLPVDLDELARFLSDRPVNTVRPGPRIGPAGVTPLSNSVFNSMATGADNAVRRAFNIVREPERGAGVPWLTGKDRVFFRPSEPRDIGNIPPAPAGFQPSPNRDEINRIFEQD